MSLEQFQNELLCALIKNDKKCTTIINNNLNIINNYFVSNEKSPFIVKDFVKRLNETILNLKKYKEAQNVLTHPEFKVVLDEFRKSDILIKGCKDLNKVDLVKWLLKMNIDPSLQDENGMTALMHAAEHYPMQFAVDEFLKMEGDFIYFTDNNGNNVLFHALQNKETFTKVLKKTNFDLNYVNSNNENLLLYCCRMDKFKSLSILLNLDIDANLINNIGRTAAMYLVENKRFVQLKELYNIKNIDVNFKNKFGENLVTVFIKKWYDSSINYDSVFYFEATYNAFKNYAIVFKELVKLGCDFNVPIDEEGTTPIMFFLLTENYVCANYILQKCNIDLSPVNNQDINVSKLTSYLKKEVFDRLKYNKTRNRKDISYDSLIQLLQNNSTFDKSLADIHINDNSAVKSYYKVPTYSNYINQWFLEVLYPNCGAAIMRLNQLTNTTGSYLPNALR